VDGLDTRTLSVVIIFLGTINSIGLLIYAKTHPSYKGFWQLGLGYALFALGFIFISFREYISNWFSIIGAGLIVLTSLYYIGFGILKFFQFKTKQFKRLFFILFILQSILLTYFVVIDPQAKWRIIVLCGSFGLQCLYIAFYIYNYRGKNDRPFTKLLCGSFMLYAAILITRALWTLLYFGEAAQDALRLAHASSLVTFIVLLLSTSFSMIWIASQKLGLALLRYAMFDSLTKIYNRKALEVSATKEISRAERNQTPLSVIMLDIDHFKQVNDQYGHQHGDKVLQDFANKLKKNIRQYDILARYGGEEFIILLPATTLEQALKLAEKLRQTVYSHAPKLSRKKPAEKISASYGVSCESASSIDWERLVGKADAALYKAKESGRNQVEAAQ
jgi:diguanylate cyclase (GGDEF)-like protein